jgi:3-dehydroquinate synthase
MVDIQANKMIINIKSHLNNYSVKSINKFNYKNLNNENNFYIIDNIVYKKFFRNKLNKKIILIRPSEKIKSYFEIGKIIKKILSIGIRRNSNLIAIGGGITQDICGFISSILFRGVNWFFYPTTLLSQGDSCIGGKTSINFGIAKNQLGNFYPPKKIFLYSGFLKKLNQRDIYSGLGEIAHYYLISGKADWKLYNYYFEKFLKNPNNFEVLQKIVLGSLLIKKKIIEKDEFDKGERLILNYGHSFGHTIEKITNYKIPHGLAVAHGMNIANYFSYKLKIMNYDEFKLIEKTLKKIVNLKEISNMNCNKFVKILKQDKKNSKYNFKLILSKGIGKMLIKEISTKQTVTKLIKQYLEYAK